MTDKILEQNMTQQAKNTNLAKPKEEKKKIGGIILAMAIPMIVGVGASLLTENEMKIYHFFNKPALSPPGWMFPVVWTVLYLMMGLASYYVITADSCVRGGANRGAGGAAGGAHDGRNAVKAVRREDKFLGLVFYGAQLVFNFGWTLLFFNASLYMVSFIWLLIMMGLIVLTTVYFFRVDKRAGWMMIPLNVWTAFAGYLNLAIYILSRTPAIMPR